MSQNPLPVLTQQLLDYFVISSESGGIPLRSQRFGELIRYHNENLSECGDVSFAANKVNWECFTRKQGLKLRVETDQVLPDERAQEDLIEESKTWIFPLKSITKLRKERYGLRFNRAPIIAHVLNSVLTNGANYGQFKMLDESGTSPPTLCLTLHEQFLDQNASHTKELHQFRAQQLHLIVKRLLAYSDWRLVEPEKRNENTLLISIECNNQPRRGVSDANDMKAVRMVCGPVLEPSTKTAATLTSQSYMALRSNDMLLIAMHRHGVRDCAKGDHFNSLMERLGHAAVIVDLFEVRHGTAANVVRNGLGSSRGASYILYNSARLETLLRTFNAQVEAGVYQPLPPIEQIDLSVLEDELDWQLIYGYLLTFPELVESTLAQLQQGICAVHLLVRYIMDLATLFSRYYRNKQILVQQRINLMPVLYARVYLVKAVREVLNAALALLGIQPVDYM